MDEERERKTERERKEERERKMEKGRKEERERKMEKGRKGGKEEGRERKMDGEREGGRKRPWNLAWKRSTKGNRMLVNRARGLASSPSLDALEGRANSV